MQTLSKGYKKPQNEDTGDVWFPALADDIQLLNDHTHNGTNSALIAITTQTFASGSWVAAPIGGGLYRQLVTLPSGFLYDSIQTDFRLSTGELLFPSVERASASTYYIYINDNSLTVTAYYR